MPGAKPEEYIAPRWAPPGQEPTKEMVAADGLMRAALSTAGISKEIGASILAESDRVANHYTALSPGEREVYTKTEMKKLAKIHKEALPQKLALARQLIAEVEEKHPGTKALLESSGAGSSALVVNLVIGHAERLAARRR